MPNPKRKPKSSRMTMNETEKTAWQSFEDCLNMMKDAQKMEDELKKRMENPQTGLDVLKNIQSLLSKKL